MGGAVLRSSLSFFVCQTRSASPTCTAERDTTAQETSAVQLQIQVFANVCFQSQCRGATLNTLGPQTA